MALINCKECGKEISDTASVCPHCGAPVVKDVYCQKCGTKVPENVQYCPACGAAMNNTVAPKKDRLVAGLLGIFLGTLGIHYFYLGKTTAGVISLILGLCSCGIWGIVMFIPGVLILTMTDVELKYVLQELRHRTAGRNTILHTLRN